MQHIIENHPDMATALLAGEKLKELILPGQQDDKTGSLAALLVQLKLELPFDRVVTIGTVLIPILLVTLVFTKNFAEEPIYCYTPHNFTRDQALYARGYCWTELKDALPGVNASHWPSLFEHKFLPYALLAFAGIMYIPALGWEFLASTRLTSELNFLLQEIDNCYHRAAEGRAPKIEKQIQSKGPGITEREKREIIENAEKEKSPEQNLFEKYLERRGRSNFLAKLYLSRHLFIIFLSIIPITYLSTYYATQKQNEFTCALGEPPDKTSSSKLLIRVNCKLPSVQLQRIIAGVDIVLLSFMNLIVLINLIHLFIFRKSNFIFDKLNKVGIKTKKQWQKSQFCDINILAMFCNENRDHIKSLNRLDFITNESDLMYDNVVRQLLAALAQSNHDATPTVRDSGIQTIDPSIDPADIDPSEPLIIKRPRKKMKWIPSTNPLPQPFKEQLATMKVENNKPEKPKPVRRKTATDSLVAPLLESTSKGSQSLSSHKADSNALSSTGNEKKHTRHFSLDVHPYILSSKKPKPEIQPITSMATSKSGFLTQDDKVIVHVTSSLKVSLTSQSCPKHHTNGTQVLPVEASGSKQKCLDPSHNIVVLTDSAGKRNKAASTVAGGCMHLPAAQTPSTGASPLHSTVDSRVSWRAQAAESSLSGKDTLYSHDTCRTVPATGAFLACNHNHIATSGAATNVTLAPVSKAEPVPALNCNPAHPLLHISTLYENHEEEVSDLIDDPLDDRIHSPTDTGDIISIPSTKQIMLATFDEPLAIVNSVEY